MDEKMLRAIRRVLRAAENATFLHRVAKLTGKPMPPIPGYYFDQLDLACQKLYPLMPKRKRRKA